MFDLDLVPFSVNPGFDDGLWKLRQEVNRLKETLAMQSAYIQTMPNPLSNTGTQAHTDITPDPAFRQVCTSSRLSYIHFGERP